MSRFDARIEIGGELLKSKFKDFLDVLTSGELSDSIIGRADTPLYEYITNMQGGTIELDFDQLTTSGVLHDLLELEDFCMKNGLSFDITEYQGPEGELAVDRWWRPGMDGEKSVNFTGDGAVVVTTHELIHHRAKGHTLDQVIADLSTERSELPKFNLTSDEKQTS